MGGDDGDELEVWEDDRSTSSREVQPTETTGSAPRPAVLDLVEGPGAPRRFELKGDEFVLGRSSKVDFNVATKDLAPEHLRLTRIGVEFRCEDLGGGLELNGVKVKVATLRHRDVLVIGSVRLYYLE